MRHSLAAVQILVGLMLMPVAASAQQKAAPTTEPVAKQDIDPNHKQLRELREALTEAVIKGDVDKQLQFATDDVVTTWQNSKVVRGKKAHLEFLNEMAGKGGKAFKGFKEPPTVDDYSILYNDGNTAIAFGKSVPHYNYMNMDFDLDNRWTATLVKQDGQWKLAAYHVSTNVLDNPVLNAAKRNLYLAGGIGGVVGLLVGVIGMKLACKKKAPAA